MFENNFDMSSLEFVIPLNKEELTIETENQYYAKRIDIKSAWKKFEDYRKVANEKGCVSIVENFDILFSVLYESQDVSFNQLQEMLDTVLYYLLEDLRRYVEDALKNIAFDRRLMVLNVLKMNIFILALFIKTYEEKLAKETDNILTDKKSKAVKGKGKTSKYEVSWDWNTCKKTLFCSLSGILQENLNSLWDPPTAEEQFVNLVANCCYKAYENSEIAQAKLKPLKDSISHVLCLLVKQYNHGLSFVNKSIELLKDFEQLPVPIAGTVLVMVTEYNCTSLLSTVVRQMVDAVRGEEAQGLGKSIGTFIISISESNPKVLIPCIKTLSKCLAYEPYTMRNAVLVVFSDIAKYYALQSLLSEDVNVRDTILKCLQNHLKDKSSYVRSKVLQLWTKLATAHAITADFFIPVLQVAKYRLTDHSSFVVKSAIQLFIAVLKDNLYSGKFNLADLKSCLAKEKETLKNIQANKVLSNDKTWNLLEANLALQLTLHIEKGPEAQDESDSLSQDIQDTSGVAINDVMILITKLLQKQRFLDAYNLLKICEKNFPESQEIRCNMDRCDEIEYYIAALKKIFLSSTTNYNPQADEYEQQKLVVLYVEESIAFAKLMIEAAKEIEHPLFGQSQVEKIEAVEFFTTAYQFSAGDCRPTVRKMIVLMWSKIPGVKEAVTNAYKTLYLESSHPNSKGQAMQAANRLIKLVKELDSEQKSAFDELLWHWFQNDSLSKEFIQVLWDIFTKKLPKYNEDDRAGALMILDIIAEKNPLLASLNLPVLIEYGLQNADDLLLIEYTCSMISKTGNQKADKGLFTRLSPEHEIFKITTDIIINKYSSMQLKGFTAMSAAAMMMIYKVCWNPLKVADNLLKELYCILIEDSKKKTIDKNKNEMMYNESLLGPFIFIYGQKIFRQWQYFDKDVFNSLRKQTNPAKFNESARIEDEYEMENQEAANDALLNSINEACETCLDVEKSLDSYLSKLIAKLSCELRPYISHNLQATAVTALIKLMLMSNSFCETYVQRLVTVMEKSRGESVRANAVLGFGDLIQRFPNTLDPWTNHLYLRLKDDSAKVRHNTVNVLCHLITLEMVKVRGQISELCICLNDPEPLIAEKVHVLLKTLSAKGNTLYNVVPDIISHLSNPEREDPVSIESFKDILKFVLGLLGKERQNDSLVEKLCVRLKESENVTQWSRLSFCLLQLNYSEKSLRRLVDYLPALNKNLQCTDVYNDIESIFTTATKCHFSKPHYREVATDGLNKLKELFGISDGTEKTKDGGKSEEDSSDNTFLSPRVSRSSRKVPRSAQKSSASETPRVMKTRRNLNRI